MTTKGFKAIAAHIPDPRLAPHGDRWFWYCYACKHGGLMTGSGSVERARQEHQCEVNSGESQVIAWMD